MLLPVSRRSSCWARYFQFTSTSLQLQLRALRALCGSAPRQRHLEARSAPPAARGLRVVPACMAPGVRAPLALVVAVLPLLSPLFSLLLGCCLAAAKRAACCYTGYTGRGSGANRPCAPAAEPLRAPALLVSCFLFLLSSSQFQLLRAHLRA